jgi:hypothetical protein
MSDEDEKYRRALMMFHTGELNRAFEALGELLPVADLDRHNIICIVRMACLERMTAMLETASTLTIH